MNIEELSNKFLSELYLHIGYYSEDDWYGIDFRSRLQELMEKVYDEGKHQGFREGIVEGMKNAKL
jgi:hypothetical protein